MSNFKEVMNRVEDNRLDSMFYKSSDHTPLRRVSFREREWVIEPFGEVRLTYKDERYYCMSEIDEDQQEVMNVLTKKMTFAV